jgi:hypothetical protein
MSLRVAALAALLAGSAGYARANGALPATIQVLLPPSAPDTIIVATNFGVISSTDGARSWRWICEHGLGLQGGLSLQGKAYQLTAPPEGRLLALANAGLVMSGDRACGWTLVLDQETIIPLDYFPDPVDPARVVALGISRAQQGTYQLAAVTTGMPPRIIYTAPAGHELSTVEVARSDPRIIYTTLYPRDPLAPGLLARSSDAGATWTMVTPAGAGRDLGILGVDPADPQRLYLLEKAGDGDRLQISSDGGQTLRMARAPGRIMSSFARLADGHLLVGWADIDRGYLDRSTDGGETFTELPARLRTSALAERGGTVYAAADYFADGYVLGASDDQGTTWRRVMGLDDVVASAECAAASECAGSCQALIARKIFTPATCGLAVDAGAADAGPVDAAAPPDAVGAGAEPPAGQGDGCSCQAGRTRARLPWSILLVLVALVRRRGRATAASTSSG